MAQGPDAPYHYRLYLSGGGDLRLDASSDLTLDQTKPVSRVVLVRGVGSLDVAYFGPDVQTAGATWASHWQQQPAPPQLVRIRLGFPPKDRRQWPTLLIRPGATIDSACVVDPNTGACQGRT
jgi:general secretion pathway protein J